MKDKLIKTIREVSIADKDYPEYIEAIADKLIAERLVVCDKSEGVCENS